jgi:ADP-heptose:LPS heptosyltransferase/Flp pilus assembly protein TadD
MTSLPIEQSETSIWSARFAEEARILRSEGRWIEALTPSRRAAEFAPGDASAALLLGILLSKLDRLHESETELRRALSLAPGSPQVRFALAQNLLAQGRYAEGWRLYDARESIPEFSTGLPRNLPFPRWRGEPLKDKLLTIFPEQGMGEQIQLARFLPRVIAQAGAVTLLTKRPLERLLRHNFPQAEILLAEGQVEFDDPDYWATLCDLPAIFGVELDNIPNEPYLRAPEAWPKRSEGYTIGLKLTGNPKHVNDKMRSLPEADAAELRAGLPGTIVSLEPNESGASDMADTAAIIEQLDLIVSVDTSVGHLAGAMGKPCLLLVPGFAPDWCWMQARTDSPWYPRHRIYRGDVDGNWQAAVNRLVIDAQAAASVQSSSAPSKVSPDPVAQLLFRAEALRRETRYSEALEMARRAVKLVPDNAGPHSVLGTLLADVGRLEEAEQFKRRAVELAPDYPAFRHDLALNLLAQGRYREAWPLYEARADVPSLRGGFPKRVPGRRWRGEPIEGKHIAILPEQGFGDEIQFARFIPELQRHGCRITLFTKPPLVSLFQASLPGLAIRSARGTVQLGNPDWWTTLIDMAQPLDVTLDSLPRAPYLQADRTWPDLPHGFRTGLCTSGNPQHANDGWRSLPPEAAARLRTGLPGRVFGLDPAESGARDFADTAALIQALDLIVSVDTSVAHLAGALGKPVLLLVPGLATDWRWMRNRDDSAWYPGHRIYRGAPNGNWDAAIDRVIADAHRAAGMPRPPDTDVAPATAGELPARSVYASGTRASTAQREREAEQLSRRGVLLTKRGELAKGEGLLRQALSVAAIQQDRIQYDLSLNLLEQGRYSEAWPLYAARRNLPALGIAYPQIQGPRWQGQDLAGKRLLVLPEQGMGDTLQLARFLPRLQSRGAKITLFERAPLVRLLRSAFPTVRVEDVARITEAGPQDYWVSSFDLLEALEVSLEDLPPPNYLTVATRLSPRPPLFRIGLCTAGNSKHRNDTARSLSPRRARELQARLPGEVVDLRPEATGAADFLDTASIMAGLDLIVSVDTAVAHLAGVIDKPCLLLVPGFSTDWRWMRDRSDSPWYPRHLLFRGEVKGEWRDAIDALVIHANEIGAAHRV